LNGVPLRLNICNRLGECVTVKTKRPLLVVGSVVEITDEDVDDFVSAIDEAADELETDRIPWEDNFDLAKLRKRAKQKTEEY
jgi:hypothetical protein